MEAGGAEDLVSKLRRVLYKNQVVLKPAAAVSGYSRQQALDDSRETLAYLSEMLLDEDEADEEEGCRAAEYSVQQYQGLFEELSEIVSPPAHLDQERNSTLDIYSCLVNCAQSVARNNVPEFHASVKTIRDGTACLTPVSRKLAAIFIDALTARLNGTGPQTYRAISARISSRQLLADVTLPSFMVTMNFANDIILRACAGAKKVHIVDYGVNSGRQWPSLIKALSVRPGGPPQLKITGVDLTYVPEALVAGHKLVNYAKANGVQLEYLPVLSDSWETVQPATSPKELLVVNSIGLGRMKDEWSSVNNPRRALFERIYRMRPKVFVMIVSNASMSSPFLLPRFEEALKYYTAKMECLDHWLAGHAPLELELSEVVIQREIMSVVACDGVDQVVRPEKYTTWDLRAKRTGFQPLPPGEDVLERTASLWGGYSASENMRFGTDENWTLLGWKDKIMCGMSAWQVCL